jgi:fucose permease
MEKLINQHNKSKQTNWTTVISISIIGLMFFIFGFVSWVNAILIPYFKIACELTHFQSYLVAFFFLHCLLFHVGTFVVFVGEGWIQKGYDVWIFCDGLRCFSFYPGGI